MASGISILVFPEGTFNIGDNPLKEMYDGAFKLAVETKTVIQPIVFIDAYDRMPYESLFRMTPGVSRAIYLEQINPSDYPQADAKELKLLAENRMSDKLIAYKASWINKKYLK